VSDVVMRGDIPEALRKDVLHGIGCICAALDDSDYRAKLTAAGFEGFVIEPTRVYRVDTTRVSAGKGFGVGALAYEVNDKFMRAVKPRAVQTNPIACNSAQG
jgi:hypothetical protein